MRCRSLSVTCTPCIIFMNIPIAEHHSQVSISIGMSALLIAMGIWISAYFMKVVCITFCMKFSYSFNTDGGGGGGAPWG